MASLAAAGAHTVALDVTDESSAEKAVADILAVHGRIDVLVNNAGYGSHGALEDVPISEARSQIEVNLFGLAHLTRAVLPAMRAQHSRTIVDISSMGGRLATPLGAGYHASKFTVEGLSDTLRLERSCDAAGSTSSSSSRRDPHRVGRHRGPQGPRHFGRGPLRRPGRGYGGVTGQRVPAGRAQDLAPDVVARRPRTR